MGKTCAWCHKKTNLPEVFAADGPLLEWFEKFLDKYCIENDIDKEDIWGVDSDWGKLDLDIKMEAKLLEYDELVASVSKKTICKECLIEDDRLYKKYYFKDDFFDDDFDINIDDIK